MQYNGCLITTNHILDNLNVFYFYIIFSFESPSWSTFSYFITCYVKSTHDVICIFSHLHSSTI